MTLAVTPSNPATSPARLDDVQHIVLDGMSWAFYEHLLREISDRAVRVTYDEGSIEIMSPLPKHERWGGRIARLIEMMGYVRGIDIEPLGSATFRKPQRRKGLEPDECFFIHNAAAARGIDGEFDAAVHPPPDLALEIDITRRSIPREPIYAALGVRELWRFEKEQITVRILQGDAYVDAASSLAFPFLPMPDFQRFVLRMAGEPANDVIRDFTSWVQSL